MAETVTIEKLVHGGQGLATLADGRKVFVWNALPGEEVTVEISKGKRKYAEAVATSIIKSSVERMVPEDAAYLSTSPWQIMSYEAENSYKQIILSDAMQREKVAYSATIKLSAGKEQWRYRNKMEYSFWADDNGLHLAMFNRGTHGKIMVKGSSIARPEIDQTAQKIITLLSQNHIRGSQLKTVVVRCDQQGNTVAALFVKDEHFPKIDFKIDFKDDSKDNFKTDLKASFKDNLRDSSGDNFKDNSGDDSKDNSRTIFGDNFKHMCKGLVVYYSTPKSPASVQTKKLYKQGDITLTDNIMGCPITYDVNSFFQVNLSIFEVAAQQIDYFINDPNDTDSTVGKVSKDSTDSTDSLDGTCSKEGSDSTNSTHSTDSTTADDSKQSIDSSENSTDKIDLYSGVGTLAIPLGCNKLVEIDGHNIAMAKKNVGTKRIEVIHAAAETALQHVPPHGCLIVDPPRAGLHTKLIDKILEAKPETIAYLSCNPSTQARDLALLQVSYDITSIEGYNFFPRTPHIESLAILKLKK